MVTPDTKTAGPSELYLVADEFVAWGHFREAATAFDRSLEIDPTKRDGGVLAAALRAAMGDVDDYRRVCTQIAQRFSDATDPQTAERSAKACLLMPGALDATDFDRVQKLAERAVTGTEKHGYFGFFAMAKGLADYRAGRYEKALEWMDRAVPHINGIHWDAMKFAVLAMAHHALGHGEEAEAALANAKAIVAKMPDPAKGQLFGPGDWHDWLHAFVLSREAEAELKKPATETGP